MPNALLIVIMLTNGTLLESVTNVFQSNIK